MQLLREEEPECKDFKNFQTDHTTKYKNVCPAENSKDVVADVPFNKEISMVWIINLISHLKIGKNGDQTCIHRSTASWNYRK